MPSATAIAARSYPDKIIGVDNKLPWHLGTDLKLFREKTLNHAVIMGRKTFESIGKSLPSRLNIVVSTRYYDDNNNIKFARDGETALFLADIYSIINGKKEFFVIGGEIMYNLFRRYINRVYLTEVFCGNINGDAKFDLEFRENSEWRTHKEREFPKTAIDDFAFRITEYIRYKPSHRFRTKEEFMGRAPDIDKYISLYQTMFSFNDISLGEQLNLF